MIGAGAMARSRHPHHAAKPFDCAGDALVISRNNDGVDAAGVRCAPVDVLDHRPSRNVSQRLAWEARRVVSGGDDGDDLWRL
jgi:hypothetical protein